MPRSLWIRMECVHSTSSVTVTLATVSMARPDLSWGAQWLNYPWLCAWSTHSFLNEIQIFLYRFCFHSLVIQRQVTQSCFLWTKTLLSKWLDTRTHPGVTRSHTSVLTISVHWLGRLPTFSPVSMETDHEQEQMPKSRVHASSNAAR